MATRLVDLIAIDLDGTLLRRDGTVSARNRAAIAEAVSLGAEVIIATGRSWIESAHVLEILEAGDAFVGAGGALLTRPRDGRTIERRAMDRRVVTHITEAILAHGHLAHLLKDRSAAGYDYLIVGEGVLDPASEWWFRTLPVEVRYAPTLADDAHPGDTVRCGTVTRARQTAKLATQLHEELGDEVFLQHWGAVTDIDDRPAAKTTHLLEAFNPDTDKWTMIERYCMRQGIDPLRIGAIGDGLNDIRMVREAAIGIAVGNAEPGVIHVADGVVSDNESDGVAEAIEILLGKHDFVVEE